MQNQFNRIIIFRALKLGDMLCSVPALRAFRKAYPKSSISLIGHKSMQSLMSRYADYIDEFIPFAGFPGLPEQEFRDDDIADFIASLKERHFDLSIQMHDSGEISNQFLELIDAKTMLAFHRNGNPYPGEGVFLPYPENIHEIYRCLKLLEGIHIYSTNIQLEFPVSSTDIDEEAHLLQKMHLELKNKQYICIHPGVSSSRKSWPLNNFVKTADVLASQGYQIVFTGSGDESDLVDEIMARMNYPAVNTAKYNLSLGQLAVLLTNCLLIICNDSGVSQLAVALKVKSIVIFINSDQERWAPIDRIHHTSFYNPSVESVLNTLKKRFYK